MQNPPKLPLSLRQLIANTEYPPNRYMSRLRATKVTIVVDSVSPHPLSLLHRVSHLEYRGDNQDLTEFCNWPSSTTMTLTPECDRILNLLSAQKTVMIDGSFAAKSSYQSQLEVATSNRPTPCQAYFNSPQEDAGVVELESIAEAYLDYSFWGVWMCSLAGEETLKRSEVFRGSVPVCTVPNGGRWMVFEEIVKGRTVPPDEHKPSPPAAKNKLLSWLRWKKT